MKGEKHSAESVLNGLNAIKNDYAWVLVHDAARPCLTHQDLNKLLQIDDEQGAILAIPAVDTIKRANEQQDIIKTERFALNSGLLKHLNFSVAIY